MCGICGVLGTRNQPFETVSAVQEMTVTLRHRGPDHSGTWASEHGLVGLGHTRLAIVDLSVAGAQPMTSADGRWTVTYNGELYNTDDLRRRLGGFRWRGHSDTEVLIEYIARHGVVTALEAVRGMFAFGCWDAENSELWLARDRFGEKPLYYGWHQGPFLFASELKALRSVPGFDPGIDRESQTSQRLRNPLARYK